jgi:high-affinity iron transporter
VPQAFVITFRDGLEAFLIVAISLAFLRKSGRSDLIPAVRWGIAASMLISVVAGLLLARAANQAWWEGVLALAAAASVATFTVYMWRTAQRLKREEVEGRLRRSATRRGVSAWLALFSFTLLMMSREGMETALLMAALIFQVRAFNLIAGAAAGLAAAGTLAWLWTRYGHRVNLPLFFQVTAIFLLVFVVQLLIDGVQKLTEANVFPNSEALQRTTEPFGADGTYGQYLSYLLVAAPLSWLLVAIFFGNGKASDGRVAHVGR